MATKLRAVEFYSGIGGMHLGLKSCGVDVNVIAAIDINTTANEVYTYNFPDTVLLNRNIEGIKLNEFIKFNADIFTMSPPCQPFTRQGNQKASDDPRTRSFLYIMKIIRSLPRPPSYILMENVKGFEISQTRDEFIRTLHETNYGFQEFLLSPSQFGVPNSRSRYFLLAALKPLKLAAHDTDSIMDTLSITLNTNTEPCLPLNTESPRVNCPVCNKERLKSSKPSESESSKPTNCIEDRPSSIPTETFSNQEELKQLVDGNSDVNLEDRCRETQREFSSDTYYHHKRNFELDSSTGNFMTQGPTVATCEENSGNNYERKRTDLQRINSDSNIGVQTSTKRNGGYLDNSSHDVIKSIEEYLEKDKERFQGFLLQDNILKKKVLLMDIVQRKCNHSCCFTKGLFNASTKITTADSNLKANNPPLKYGHYVEGTGSILQMSDIDSSLIFEKYNKANEKEKTKILTPLGLRYFTPREIANLLCFPRDFDFPDTISRKQKYRLLGNSLNVLVVAKLMKILFTAENKQ